MRKIRRRVFAGALAVMIALTGCGSVATGTSEGSSSGEFDEESTDVRKKTSEIEGLIDKYFYFDEDEESREEGYYDGIMAGLDDPYSVYYTKEEYEEMQEEDSGEFGGIGATVSKDKDTGNIYLVKIFEDSPAESAGLKGGDVVVAVDGTYMTDDMDTSDAVSYIRGEVGTEVVLTIYREGETDYLEITVTRGIIESPSVEYEMLEDNIGFIRIEQFVLNTPEQFEEAVDDLVSQGADGLVIDLRYNPGGRLVSVVDMVDYLVDDDAVAEGASAAGLIVTSEDKNGEVIEKYECDDGHSVDIPMVVLGNGGSASASEIFIGALKDYGVAEFVGTTTFGKGIVQSIIELSDGSAIKLTIAKYFLPSGENIHGTGIEPDVEVELDSGVSIYTSEHYEDNQLAEALEILGAEPLTVPESTATDASEE